MSTLRILKLLLALFFTITFFVLTATSGIGQTPGDNLASLARSLRDVLLSRVGSLDKMRVPERLSDLPQPRLADGTPDPRFAITEAKRYLGKQLFFDPIRNNRIRPEMGGLMSTMQTASCGSCHLGEAGGKAGQTISFAVGAEGRGYTDENGLFHFRRRVLPGQVDVVPTGITVEQNGIVIMDGRFDAVDSVPRLAPTVIGLGFNNRLLLGGKAGEPGFVTNPDNLPAGENLAQLANDSHRMLGTQKNALQQSRVYLKLFQDAFPAEARQAAASGKLDDLINDDTVQRAMAAFMRSVVTRNTPWDRFLAGDDQALTESQIRGARLFINSATQGGAGCISCHSGPMLNKQLGDEAGLLVEENFHNLGIGDHPLQELARQALGNGDHHDIGRGEITGRAEDNYKFRTLTLRQLKDAGGQYMHSSLFRSVRRVVEYFNAGVPGDALAIAAGNVTSRFTHPRGEGSAPGLGLTDAQVNDLVDFLENALYDPTLRNFDPNATTDTLELNVRDLTYSSIRPDLAGLGAIDGLTAGGFAASNNDGLSRRDRGLEFLDVTKQIHTKVVREFTDAFRRYTYHRLRIVNNSDEPIDTHLLICFRNMYRGDRVMIAEGETTSQPSPGMQYVRVFLPDGVLQPRESIDVDVKFMTMPHRPLRYDLTFLSGQGQP